MSPARVLVVAEQLRRPVPAGIGTYIRGLLGGLHDLAGPTGVTLLASRAGGGPDPLAALGHPVRTVPLPGPLLTRAWDRGWLAAPRGFDVVHATALAFPAVARRDGAALVVTVHDLAFRRVPDAFPPRGRRWHEAALARALDSARAFVAPSPDTADDLAAAGADPAAIEVVEEGGDHLPPPDEAATDHLLHRLGVGAGEFLLTVGTLEPRKNLTRLLAAYAGARTRLPAPWPLVIVGAAGWGQAPGSVPDGVRLAGSPPDAVLAGLYARARCLAYVPLLEGFGLPPAEAFHAGCPVVASTAVPSARGAALEVDPLDVPAMAAALVAAAAEERTRHELIERGRTRAGQLRWSAAAAAHAALWERLA